MSNGNYSLVTLRSIFHLPGVRIVANKNCSNSVPYLTNDNSLLHGAAHYEGCQSNYRGNAIRFRLMYCILLQNHLNVEIIDFKQNMLELCSKFEFWRRQTNRVIVVTSQPNIFWKQIVTWRMKLWNEEGLMKSIFPCVALIMCLMQLK